MPNSARLLIKPYQKLLGLKAQVEWDYDYSQAQLGIECDTNYRLEGLGTWRREWKDETSPVDQSTLKTEQKNIYDRYQSKKPDRQIMFYNGQQVKKGTREVPEFADSQKASKTAVLARPSSAGNSGFFPVRTHSVNSSN